MTQVQQEWQHIAVYQAGQADAFSTMMEIAPELTPATKKWLRERYELAREQQSEAEAKLA